jgi:hypothetical protein
MPSLVMSQNLSRHLTGYNLTTGRETMLTAEQIIGEAQRIATANAHRAVENIRAVESDNAVNHAWVKGDEVLS